MHSRSQDCSLEIALLNLQYVACGISQANSVEPCKSHDYPRGNGLRTLQRTWRGQFQGDRDDVFSSTGDC